MIKRLRIRPLIGEGGIRRKRKRRTTSKPMCVYCGNICCEVFWPDTPAKRKIQARVKAGLCPGCGQKECRCKRKE